MITLGFDTATHATVVGLRLADGSAAQERDDPAPAEHPGHATGEIGWITALDERRLWAQFVTAVRSAARSRRAGSAGHS